MRKAAKLLKKKNVWGLLNCLALFFVIFNSQLLCFWYTHQPELPAEADKYRKFK
ncbi:MAG: cyclic lactone autoinducer peptide [Lachnospiraceae bacterium]|nr:cyclic lactone autoinducer peptide [Lachnospiraceae bacterium]